MTKRLRFRAPDSGLTVGILCLCTALLGTGLWAKADSPEAFRVYTSEPGVYRLHWEDLAKAGLGEPLPSVGLGLRNLGQPVPIYLDDGDDGELGPGDSLEFVAGRLHGDDTFLHEYAPLNVYQLSTDEETPARMDERRSRAKGPTGSQSLRGHHHLEEDKLLIRLSRYDLTRSKDSEIWYWAKLTHIDKEPFRIDLGLGDLDPEGGEVEVELRFRALSEVSHFERIETNLKDHRVEILLNGEALGEAEWNGRVSHSQTLTGLSAGLFAESDGALELRIPKRVPEGKDGPLIDVVMLDWVKVSYPSQGRPGSRRIEVAKAIADRWVRLGPAVEATPGEAAEPVTVYTASGGRIEGGPGQRIFDLGGREPWLHAVAGEERRVPIRVEVDHASDLAVRDQRADYLMITHPRLREPLEPLAELHRRRGLEVKVVEVQDVYDEFNHGIVHPRAIRDFVAHAHHYWRSPAPRFVLLVGDASWDSKNSVPDDANYANWATRQFLDSERFVARETTSYEDLDLPRDLIPTFDYHSSQGHSASDNGFVTVEGDDYLPDLAIGRFPVALPEEVEAIVAKTIRYAETPPVGPWRREILWITNDDERFQERTDQLAATLDGRGFGSRRVYPVRQEKNNQEHQRSLQDSFDSGQLLVHFYGHGGRNIWRTGPPRLKKNHDLFTLDHIEDLQPTGRLPLVLSMTCFSAPFDHPTADSIGEKFLRTPERGAVAVLAASWRTNATLSLSYTLLPELLEPGVPIGTAILKAKRRLSNRTVISMYNLLGDPALPLALPAKTLKVEAREGGILATLPAELTGGKALVEWLGPVGEVLAEEELELAGSSLDARFPGVGQPSEVRVYAWNEAQRTDAIGGIQLLEPAAVAASAAAGKRP